MEPKIEKKSRPVPVRFSPENDGYIQRIMKERQYQNRNETINILIKEHSLLFEKYRQRAKEEIIKLMRDWEIKSKELE